MNTTLRDVRLKACRLWPCGSHAILTLVPIAKPGIGTMGVDRFWRLYYDPEFLDRTPPDQLAGVIIHEVCHCLFQHHKRADRMLGKDAPQGVLEAWNWATDFAINSMLRAERITLTPQALYPEQAGLPDGLSGEEYFRRLQEKANARNERDETGRDSQPGDDGSPDDSGSPGQSPGNSGGDGDPADGCQEPGKGPGSQPGESGGGGSCSDGRQRPWEDPSPADGGSPGLKPHEQEIIVHQAAERITEKYKGSGRGMAKWANEVLNPKVDPRQALLHMVRQAVEVTSGQGEYSFRRPNRRNPSRDMLRPASVQPVPRITVIVDTSGSMDQKDLGLSLGLIGKVLNGFRIRDGIKVICGDTAVASVSRVFDPRQLTLAGGGGTDMGVLIQEAAKLRPKPQLIVVCTDGETGWCGPVGVPVVACVTRQRRAAQVPEWIKRVVLE